MDERLNGMVVMNGETYYTDKADSDVSSCYDYVKSFSMAEERTLDTLVNDIVS